jgi:DNA-binding MarR family transcriptional regulator
MPGRASPSAPPIDYATLADLRYQLRRFMRAREVIARKAGIEPQQYLVLLQIKGLAGRGVPNIGVLAERLQIGHHAAVQLVDRLARRGVVERQQGGRDRREVVVCLRRAGETIVRQVAGHSIDELTAEGPQLVSSLNRLIKQSTRGRARPRPGPRKATR